MNRTTECVLAQAASVALVVILAACQSGQSGGEPDEFTGGGNSEQPTNPSEPVERASYPFGLACGWQLASNIDTVNFAYPDESAKYWLALVPMLPGSRLRIDGRYPDARYFSFNVYDPLLRPVDAIADAEVLANAGGLNPFNRGANDRAGDDASTMPWGDTYAAYVEFSGIPEARAPNTIYSGEIDLGGNAVPQPALTALIYRVYVPGEGKAFDGGVGLPILTLETADGETELVPTADCAEPLLPTLGNTITELGLNDLIESVDFIGDPFLQLGDPLPVGNPNPTTVVFYGLPQVAIELLRGYLGLPIPDAVADSLPLPAGGGFLSNVHNAYTTNLFSRNYGNIVMIRGKAPTFRGLDRTRFGDEQLRYWSVCQNELATQRYVACVADHQAHPDADGYYTMVVSDVADRPPNAIAANHIDWMPWGPYPDAILLYRNMLPDADFGQAVHHVPQGTPPEQIMGEYTPVGAYCQPDIFENAGHSAAEIFAACRRYTEGLGGLMLPGA